MKRILLLILILSILASGCASQNDDVSQVVEPGDTVSVNYVGEFQNGTVFDTSIEEVAQKNSVYNSDRTYEPLVFVAGAGQMIQGFDEAVMGMAVGEEKEVEIPPAKAYGDLYINISTEEFAKANITPVVGDSIVGTPFTIVNVSDVNVTLENKHPYAGETLIFTIEVVSIESGDSSNNS